MTTKKRFYIDEQTHETGKWVEYRIRDRNNFYPATDPLHDWDDYGFGGDNYLQELCGLLNTGHEATDGLQDASDEALIGELRRRIEQANKAELDNWIYVTYDIHSDAVLTEPEATEAER